MSVMSVEGSCVVLWAPGLMCQPLLACARAHFGAVACGTRLRYAHAACACGTHERRAAVGARRCVVAGAAASFPALCNAGAKGKSVPECCIGNSGRSSRRLVSLPAVPKGVARGPLGSLARVRSVSRSSCHCGRCPHSGRREGYGGLRRALAWHRHWIVEVYACCV